MKAHTVNVVRFYKPKPKAAQCAAYSSDRKLLAISREDGSIEIFNFCNPNAPVLETCIPGQGTELDRSIEAMCFVNDGRLFSVGLHGFVKQHFICEKDRTDSFTPEFWSVTSGAAWCMKYNEVRNKLAVGTEEGFVCIFDVVPDGLNFDKVLDKQEGRILSLDWHIDGFHIVTGSTDTIRIWNVDSGHPVQRMSTGRSERNAETTVWSVLILKDFTVVSGDSRGKTSFWNGQNGTLMDSYQSHRADILCVTATPDETLVYASGVDPAIIHFQPIVKNSRSRWVKSITRHVNTHDVRAMLVIEDKRLVSLGIDAKLHIDPPKFMTNRVYTYQPFGWGNNATLASHAKMLALRYDHAIELWKLGSATSSKQYDNSINYDPKATFERKPADILKISQEPLKVFEIKCNPDESLHNVALSSDAEFMAYCSKSKLKLLKLDMETPRVQKMSINASNKNKTVPHLLKFSDDKKLITADELGNLMLFNLETDPEKATIMWSINLTEKHQFEGIQHLDVHADGSFCVVADHKGVLLVFDLINMKLQCKLPKNDDNVITCLAIHPQSKNVMVSYSNHHFVECCTKSGKYTKLTNILMDNLSLLPKQWLQKSYVTKGILFPQSHLSGLMSKKSDTVIFYDEEYIAVLDRQVVMNDIEKMTASTAKKQAKSNGKPGEKTPKKKEELLSDSVNVLRLSKRYEQLAFLGTLTPENTDDVTSPLVAVEVKPHMFDNQLPPGMRQKKFGAM